MKITAEQNEKRIEELRVKMMNAASTYGFSHPLVLYYSEKLDRHHNMLMELDPPAAAAQKSASFQII
ncbi:aspartyl-phosphate phosphatase Spo0E family protein [Sinobaca sp. H24]|uniref:aspartyl-phosphate phosphatase Spo0E family protein n=1 Tax=Sinobaca sp. H24 TaxID=2923376 RepID=UPI00207AD113|nr:aspartyl-phosphate phosphatase Spo0E family protein [Sinobaca sp. H24]